MAGWNTSNPKLRTTLRWLARGLILAVIIPVVVIVVGGALRQIALGQMVELTGGRVRAESVDFNLNGLVCFRKLVISPFRKRSYDDTILKAETAYARFGIGSLLLLRPRLKEVKVEDFVFNAQYNLDTGGWNVGELRIKVPKGGGEGLPVINLRGGRLQYSEVSDGRVAVVAAVPIDASFSPMEEGSGGYRFEITAAGGSGSGQGRLLGFWQPGKVTVGGRVLLDKVSIFERCWEINSLRAGLNYDEDNKYSFELRVDDLTGENKPVGDIVALDKLSIFRSAGAVKALQVFFAEYRPTGRIGVNLKVWGGLNRLSESTISGRIDCKDVTVCVRKFPYLIEHLNGPIEYSGQGVLLDGLTGRHGDVKLYFTGWAKGLGSNWSYGIRMTSENMALDADLYNALGRSEREFWSLFSPRGPAAIDYSISRQSSSEKESRLTVKLLGVEAKYKHFPYPLRNLSGKLFFDEEGVTFSNIFSREGKRKIIVNGKVRTGGVGGAIYDISIDVNNIPLDSELEAALPGGQRQLYAQFRPGGLADGKIKVFTPEGEVSGATYVADLSFRRGSLESVRYPLSISNVSAKGVFRPDSIYIDAFTGRQAGGELSLGGQIWLGQRAEDLRYFLVLNGKRAQLGDELFGLLPESLEKIVSEFQPGGRIDYRAEIKKAEPNEYPDYKIAVDCLGDSANYRKFPYPLEDVTGSILITKKGIWLRDISATAGDGIRIGSDASSIQIKGKIDLMDNAIGGGSLELSARDIGLDARLGVALPESIKGFYSRLSPRGRFDVNSASIRIRAGEKGGKYIDFNAVVRFKDSSFEMPEQISGLNAQWQMKGLYKTGQGWQRCAAHLSADSMKVEGKSLSRLEADVCYDKQRRSWFTRNLVANCYGGRLTGRFELREPAQANSEYALQVGFDNIDLKQFLSEPEVRVAGGSRQYSSGKLEGSLSIGGQMSDRFSRVGRCRLAINDMQVGRLSPLAKLLYVLKLTEPKDFAFNRMVVDSYIKGGGLYMEKFDLSGEALAFYGSGRMDLESKKVDLVLTVRGDRLAAADPSVLQSVAEALGGVVVRIEVTGEVYDPQVQTRAFPVIQDSLKILGRREGGPKS